MSDMETEMDEEMEEEMEEIVGEEEVEEGELVKEEEEEFLFGVEVIDFDYEYDASKYFDLSREETPSEAKEAEAWFEIAESYPPSPFAVKLSFGEDAVEQDVNTSPKPKEAESLDPTASHSDIDMSSDTSEPTENCEGQEGSRRESYVDLQTSKVHDIQSDTQLLTTGLTFYDHMAKDKPNAKTKYAKKSSLPRGSTLMKPTASQLAKQNQREVHAPNRLGRYQKPFLQPNQRSLENPAIESQAAKRQKLEGGHLRKVVDTKQQTNLIHKAPKIARPVDTKLKLTIPREPSLETAHRAHRARPKNNTELGERVKSTTSTFRARPLNRKILAGPSLPPPKKSTPRLPEFHEFHLKTSERAMQHSSAASSTMQPSKKTEKVPHKTKSSSTTYNGPDTRSNSINAPKLEGCEPMHKFKARPLNKKIFSSRGDIGVFRNSKRETTVPMEFNLSTDKRSQHHPPVELFNKLSLTSELQQNTVSQTKSAHPTCLSTKDSKENSVNSFQQEQRITHVVKGKAQRFGGNLNQCGVDREINEIGTQVNTRRSLGIR